MINISTNLTVQEYIVAPSAQVAVMDNQLMFKNNDSKGSLIVILLRRLNCVFDSESTWDHSGSGTMFTFSTIAIIWAFMAGILLYILKLKFALKIWTAKTHVKVFNHSLALCLFVSGDDISYDFQCYFVIFSGIGTVICVPASILLLNKERSYEEESFQNSMNESLK